MRYDSQHFHLLLSMPDLGIITVKIPPASSVVSLIPDTANPDSPWANQKVREAVEYAITRKE